jgi:hypothetical protein
MAAKSPRRSSVKPLIRKLRKPNAPPTRIIEDERKYKRARERDRQRKSDDEENSDNAS